ncbi:HAD family hydrolase [Candidatus Woesearchaeota archaeon]|nr:HAD family hydrolase [Candidatus Woesearchaeota archaeon]
MVKAIIFDFWGTLVENGVFPSPVRQVQMILGLEMPFHEYVVCFEEAFMVQGFDDLYEAFENVCNAFGIIPEKWRLDKLVGMWNRHKFYAKPFPETIKVLEGLKGRYKLVLLSNTDCFSVDELLDKYNLRNFFDSVILSYKEGKLKTNQELFKKALEGIGLSSEEVLMVGDSLESDIRAAEQAGIEAVLVDRRDRREYPQKIRTLEELEEVLLISNGQDNKTP